MEIFMQRLYVAVCTLCMGVAGVFAQDLDIPHVPGEILVTYEVTEASKNILKGKAILQEHEQFVAHLQDKLITPILDQKPVFNKYVNQLVKEDIPETQLLSQIRQRHASRKGISLSQLPSSGSYQFSRRVKLTVADEELISVFEELTHQKNKVSPEGYKITHVSLNNLYELAAEPNDPLFTSQYAHALTGAVAAWEIEKGNGDVIIGVIDSGIDPNHEDLVGNILPGTDFVSRPQLDTWQLIDGEDYFSPDNDPTDFGGHGTHVSGVVAARNDNNTGLSGVCPECKILPIRTFASYLDLEDEEEDTNGNGRRDTIERSTTTLSEAAEGLIYAVTMELIL